MIFDAFARRLRGRHSWRREQEHVAQLVVERPQDTTAFAEVLDLELERRGFDVAVHAVRSSLLDLVGALVHDDATQLAVRLASRPGPPPPGTPDPDPRRGRGAMQVAATRPAAQIWQLLAAPDGLRRSDPEFGTLLLHELVVRGEPAPASARWFVDWSREAGHPLAVLPPELLPVELGLPDRLPRYGAAVGTGPISYPGATPAEKVPLGDVVNGLGAALAVDGLRIGATFRDWVEHSNGRVAIGGFAPGTTFPYLPPPCLTRGLGVERISPAAAVELLFASASTSGAYATGPGGGASRLRTWEAISGIVGQPSATPVRRLADAAERTHWIKASPEDPWFAGIAWDIWLIGATGDRIVVVAATDTD